MRLVANVDHKQIIHLLWHTQTFVRCHLSLVWDTVLRSNYLKGHISYNFLIRDMSCNS